MMFRTIPEQKSERHQIPFDRVPSCNRIFNDSGLMVYKPDEYGKILDSIFEMADMIMHSNGISAEAAIAQVIKDEKWRVLYTHTKMLTEKLK